MPIRLRTASFWIKCALALGVVALANGVIYARFPGAGLGVLALALIAAAFMAHAPLRRGRLSGLALLIAAAFAVLQVERASLLGCLLFAVAVGVAVLAPRAASADDAWRWVGRLLAGALKAIPGPFRDFQQFLKVRARRPALRISPILLAAVLPVWGGAVFLWLFATANPLIGQMLGALRLPELDIPRCVFSLAAGWVAWTVLRPRGMRWRRLPTRKRDLGLPSLSLAGVSVASITASLLVFNGLFALQNGLDIAYLWGGAALPDHMTLAQYAHRGAYPLIATALLAGLFVLVFLRPGSAAGQARWPRILVTVWVAQNLFLVASTALRTVDYVQAYSLTRLRIAALIWMALVAAGLALICWRLLRGKSSSWLINANALAAGIVLAACSVVDLGAVAAAWNVRHAREAGGGAAALDLCYLRQLRGAAIVSMAELERRPIPEELRERLYSTRRKATADVAKNQADWRGWRWRDARRLARVRELTGPDTAPFVLTRCYPVAPIAQRAARPAQLTPPSNLGT